MTEKTLTTSDKARGNWAFILEQLGIPKDCLANRHGPCPICGGKDRFRFDDKEGRGTWFCSHCGAGDGFALLKSFHHWNFSKAASEIDRINISPAPVVIGPGGQTEESKLALLRRVWRESRKITNGDPVWRYLRSRAQIIDFPQDIRYHPSLRYSRDEYYPAMVSLLRYSDGRGATIHRTYLTPTGEKAAVDHVKKLMPGNRALGAAIHLAPPSDGKVGIAEGIETALAASSKFGIPFWAATSATLLGAWAPPPGVREVVIGGDNDHSFSGQAAAYSLAKNLAMQGYTLKVHIPSAAGTDWAS